MSDCFVSNSARPPSYLLVGTAHIQPNAHREDLERQNSKASHSRSKVCQEILESELLRWDGRNSHGTNNPEIYSETRNYEVNERQFTTASEMRCPPCRLTLW